jgi:nicotinamidase-related amidase
MKLAIRTLSFLCITVALLSCTKSESPKILSDQNKILKFLIVEYENLAEIDHEKNSINLYFGANANLSMVTPIIITSNGATVDPPSQQTIDLTQPIQYHVVAENGKERSYTLMIQQFTDTALMVVDIQNGYFPFYNDTSIVEKTLCLINKTRASEKNIIFIQTDYTSPIGDPDSPIGTWEFLIPQALDPRHDDVYVVKRVQDSFDNSTSLVSVLNERMIGSLVICGIATQNCVHGTIIGGIERGYNIIAAGDAHSSYDPYAQDRIDQYNDVIWPNLGVTVLDVESILF